MLQTLERKKVGEQMTPSFILVMGHQLVEYHLPSPLYKLFEKVNVARTTTTNV
jgi:hypothetical protein